MSNQIFSNKAIIDEFRANSGKVGGRFAGRTLLLLHTGGAKSGQDRINPTAYITDGDQLVIIASKGGALTNPELKSWTFLTVHKGSRWPVCAPWMVNPSWAETSGQ